MRKDGLVREQLYTTWLVFTVTGLLLAAVFVVLVFDFWVNRFVIAGIILLTLLIIHYLFYVLKKNSKQTAGERVQHETLFLAANELYMQSKRMWDFLISLKSPENKPGVLEKGAPVISDFNPDPGNDTSASLSAKIKDLITAIRGFGDFYALQATTQQENGLQDNDSILQSYFFTVVAKNYVEAVIFDMNTVAEPLSVSVFEIKKRLSAYLEHITDWQNEFTRIDSEKNFNSIINTYNSQNDAFNDMLYKVEQGYNDLSDNLYFLDQHISDINTLSGMITDISDKIKVLSINASIESSKAGVYGRSFKVVSEEVKKLSGETHDSVEKIVPIVKDVTDVLMETIHKFDDSRSKIIRMMENQNEKFNNFYTLLDSYYNEIKAMFSKTSRMIEEVHKHIDKLVPVFNKSNLSVQILENILRMTKGIMIDILERNKSLENELNTSKNKAYISEILTDAISLTTTEEELGIMKKIANTFHIDLPQVKRKQKVDIEFF